MQNGAAEEKAVSAVVQAAQGRHGTATLDGPNPIGHSWSDPIADNTTVVSALHHGLLGDPFSILGPHYVDGRMIVRSFQPGARSVQVVSHRKCTTPDAREAEVLASLVQVSSEGLFSGEVPILQGTPYVLKIEWPASEAKDSVPQWTEDPYAFDSLLGDLDLYLIAEGRHYELGSCLGAQPLSVNGVPGTRFAVWAPNARRVSVVGDFNCWDGRRHPMRRRHGAGVWELFIPRLAPGARYKYDIVAADGSMLPQKADPVARAAEPPPKTASLVPDAEPFVWTDEQWMRERQQRQSASSPMSIYEVHAGSWRHAAGKQAGSIDWNALAEQLIPYVADMGFTHIELMPIMEHPFGGSWGYQPLGQFAPSARYGSAQSFAAFVNRCHRAGIGVILDWVPAHFPTDVHGLAQFDGTALYEHQDRREGFHPDWNTLIYNVGRNEVRGFLIASALEWLQRYHIDGLRVDAVSSMLYRDYSRREGEWVPNIHGGRENLESIGFLQSLNQVVAERCPGALVIAEESTAWPGVSHPVEQGGLGFSYKWNMGWMHDSLQYMQRDPLFRQYHHHDLTFGLCYAFNERFVLPISHDEVVHGKGSLLNKMPGDWQQKLANLRAYLGFMWTHPGKKLLFMGCEFAQHSEWNHDAELPWYLLEQPQHRGVQHLVRDLNALYRRQTALHGSDCDAQGFDWIIGDDANNSVYAFLRRSTQHANAAPVLVVCNFTPVARFGYRVGVPGPNAKSGKCEIWRELLNTDSAIYGGTDLGNLGYVKAEQQASHGYPSSLVMTLPPLSTIVLQLASG